MKQLTLISAVAVCFAVATAAANEPTVKIGVLTDMSGVYSDIAGKGSMVAAQMAVEASGLKAKGVKIEVISADHQNKADVASAIARRWIDTEGVNVIVDVPTSSAATAVNEIARKSNAVVLFSGAASAELTGKSCSPHSIHWTYDTWMLAHGTGLAVLKNGGDSWFFISPDYAFGRALEAETASVVKANGGKVLGSVFHPFPGHDFSSFLLQGQASGAKIVAFGNSGGDLVNSIRQAREFGIPQGGQKLAGLLVNSQDVHAIGLEGAQGLMFASPFDWNLDDQTREWSARFEKRMGSKPTLFQAGVYSSVLHYLKAIEVLKSTDADSVVQKMKDTPTEDPLFGKGVVRVDGRKLHDVYLFRVKTPAESKQPWDYFQVVSVIPADQAFRPLADGGCPLVK